MKLSLALPQSTQSRFTIVRATQTPFLLKNCKCRYLQLIRHVNLNDRVMELLLLDKKIHLNVKSKGGLTPLHLAARKGYQDSVKVRHIIKISQIISYS